MPVDDIGKIINRQIGARLHNARTRRGLSQDKLGHALGVTFQQVQKYENGSNGLVAAKLSQLADILGVTVNYFYDAPDGAAPELPRLRQKFMRLIQNLQRIEAQRPATFLAICKIAATLAQASPLAASHNAAHHCSNSRLAVLQMSAGKSRYGKPQSGRSKSRPNSPPPQKLG